MRPRYWFALVLPCASCSAATPEGLARGTNFNKFCATGSSRLGQMTPATPLQLTLGCLAAGSAEKSPPASAGGGKLTAVARIWVGVEIRNPSYAPKKKALFRTIGPPTVPPNWF